MINPSNKAYYPLLDVLRGVAALLVFADHFRNLFFREFACVTNPSIIIKIFYLFTGLGHEAVMIFFALSGCVIAHVIQTLHDKKKWSWRTYVVARLTRLWIVLIPALLLTALWDYLGLYLSSETNSIYKGEGFGSIINESVFEKLNILTFVGNIFFLQTILTETFGSNGPLWSITYEFIYYIVYPLIILSLSRSVTSWFRVIASLAAVGLLLFAGEKIVALFPVWLMGVGSYWCYKKYKVSRQWILPGFLIGFLSLLGCLVASRYSIDIPGSSWSWPLGISTSIMIYFGMFVELKMKLITKPFVFLSSISYSVYLLHMPFLVFLASRNFQNNSLKWPPDFHYFISALLIATITFLYCILIWYYTEKRTELFRSLIFKMKR